MTHCKASPALGGLLFVLALFSSVQAWSAPNSDTRPGFRNVFIGGSYFSQDANGNSAPQYLKLGLRKCTCSSQTVPRLPQLNTRFHTALTAQGPSPQANRTFCPCWSDFRQEDQPAPLGDPRVFTSLVDLFSQPILGVTTSWNKVSGEPSIIIPTPDELFKVLKDLNIAHVEIVPGGTFINGDSYLRLLAQGKIPVGGISKGNYRVYFHDLFNHVPLWVFFPEALRNEISRRAQKLLDTFDLLSKSHSDSKPHLHWIRILKNTAGQLFDVEMGSLNSRVFNPKGPLLKGSGQLATVFHIKEHLEKALNFGLDGSDWSSKISTYSNVDLFVSNWFEMLSGTLANDLLDLANEVRSPNDLNFIEIIRTDPEVYRSFEYMQDRPSSEIRKIASSLLRQVQEELGRGSGQVNLTSVLDFVEAVRANIQKTLRANP